MGVAHLRDRTLVRDMAQADGPVIQVSHEAWRTFLDGVRAGEFDV